MSYSFEYIDIILLAMIAGFIFLRLRGILGKRTGFEGKAPPKFEEVLNKMKTENVQKINENFAERSRQSFEKEISDALIDKIGFETPPSMVNNYLNNILEDVKKQNNGEKIDEQKVLETYRPSAERNLKWYLIRKKLIDQEQLSFSRSDIDAKVESLISRTPQS